MKQVDGGRCTWFGGLYAEGSIADLGLAWFPDSIVVIRPSDRQAIGFYLVRTTLGASGFLAAAHYASTFYDAKLTLTP